MPIPFSVEQFLDVFARFNQAIWPAQIGGYALALAAVVLALRGGHSASWAVPSLLAGAWAFVGVGYHFAFFSTVNPAALLFGALFLAQSALLAEAALHRRVSFGHPSPARAVLGLVLVAYAAIVYPIIGAALGHAYPRSATFGVTPCPTTIFTFGVLLFSTGAFPRWLLLVPFFWSLVGVSAALQLGIREDFGLLVAAVLGVAMLGGRRRDAVPAVQSCGRRN